MSAILSQGQIFADLGKDAKTNPKAVVTLILDNADVTCTVAPAVFFYRVCECGQDWATYDDGAFYSRMSINLTGGTAGRG